VLSCLAREGHLSHKDLGEEKTRHWTRRAGESPRTAQVAFKNLMTHGSAIRTAYRTSLRSSSLWEPRHPPLRIYLVVVLSKTPLFGLVL
jgi:hypothetical protein